LNQITAVVLILVLFKKYSIKVAKDLMLLVEEYLQQKLLVAEGYFIFVVLPDII